VPVSIWETDDAYHVALLAPGLDAEAINLTVQDDQLVFEGELRVSAQEGSRLIWQEFGPGTLRRVLQLGTAVNASRTEAIYRNGLLLITLPKLVTALPRRVPVDLSGLPSPDVIPPSGDRFHCPIPGCGYVRYRRWVGDPVPQCPKHGALVRG
jgi:HSP20 family protein